MVPNTFGWYQTNPISSGMHAAINITARFMSKVLVKIENQNTSKTKTMVFLTDTSVLLGLQNTIFYSKILLQVKVILNYEQAGAIT
jgi:hypothetical protein